MGLIGFVLGTILHDIPTVLLPTEAFARRPTMWMHAMHDYRGTITFAPNFAYALAAKRSRDKDLEGLDLSKMRVAGCGAEPINPQVMRSVRRPLRSRRLQAEALMPCVRHGRGDARDQLPRARHDRCSPTASARARDATGARRRPQPRAKTALELVAAAGRSPATTSRSWIEDGDALPDREVGEIVTRARA